MPFSDQDPFDFSSNVLSPRSVRDAYLNAATSIASGITFSALVSEQQELDTSALDAALAVQIDAYQKQLLGQSLYFSTVTTDFVQLAAGAGNFSTLMQAFSTEAAQRLVGAEADAAKRSEVVDLLDTLADEAGTLLLGLSTIDTHLKALEGNLLRNSASYDAAVAAAVTQLGAKAAAAQADIDRLNKSVAERISDIVKGANEEGEAVADLFIGILTQFTKSGATPNAPKAGPAKPEAAKPDPAVTSPPTAAASLTPKTDPAKPTAKTPKTGTEKPVTKPADKPKDETPNADFVIKAVKASFNGVSKYSSAIRNLELDNAELADAYMRLAALNPLVAVAKSAQGQKTLFATAVAQTRLSMTALRDEWTAVRKNFVLASKEASAISTASEAKALGRLAVDAAKMWAGVSDEIDAIKRALTGSGGLPGS